MNGSNAASASARRARVNQRFENMGFAPSCAPSSPRSEDGNQRRARLVEVDGKLVIMPLPAPPIQ